MLHLPSSCKTFTCEELLENVLTMVCGAKLKPRIWLHKVLYLSTQLKICNNYDNFVIHFCCLQTVYLSGLSSLARITVWIHIVFYGRKWWVSSVLHVPLTRMIMVDWEETACTNSCTLLYGSRNQVFLHRKSTVFMCRKQADWNMQFYNKCTVNITSMYDKWTEIHDTTLYSCSKVIQSRNNTAITSEIFITY